MIRNKVYKNEAGNAAIIALVAVVILAVGVLAYFAANESKEVADQVEQEITQNQQEQPQVQIEPGNPVVAKVGDTEITRSEVFTFIQSLPENARQLPLDRLFPAALDQVISGVISNKKTEGINLDNDPKVREQLEVAKQNIVRQVYIQNQVDERLTEERIQQAYEQYKNAFQQVPEVRARHILVETKSKAEELIKELEGGADFAELAREHSVDNTAQNGGEVGYFAQGDVVPAFGNAAFSLEPGTFTKEPVETEFGFHVIQTQEKRQRPVPGFDQVGPLLAAQLRRVILQEILEEWRSDFEIERFDINGKPIEPAAGEGADQDVQSSPAQSE